MPPQAGPVEDKPAGAGHGADGSGHPECRDSVPCRLEQNGPRHSREGRSVHVLRAEASKRGKPLGACGLDRAVPGAVTGEPSQGSPEAQRMSQPSLDQSFRNLTRIFVPCFYLNHEMLLDVFIHSLQVFLGGVESICSSACPCLQTARAPPKPLREHPPAKGCGGKRSSKCC